MGGGPLRPQAPLTTPRECNKMFVFQWEGERPLMETDWCKKKKKQEGNRKLTSKYSFSLSSFQTARVHTCTHTKKKRFYACLLITFFFFRDRSVESKTSSYIYTKLFSVLSSLYITPIYTRNQKNVSKPAALRFSFCYCWVVRFCHSNRFKQPKYRGKWRCKVTFLAARRSSIKRPLFCRKRVTVLCVDPTVIASRRSVFFSSTQTKQESSTEILFFSSNSVLCYLIVFKNNRTVWKLGADLYRRSITA